MKRINFTSVVWFSICRMCDGGTVEYLRDLVCHKEALQVNQQQINEKIRQQHPENFYRNSFQIHLKSFLNPLTSF